MLPVRASGKAALSLFLRGDKMLNIPETVKALYKRDGVNKNFRAHFPNGELPDITNENIVQESVKFQESVCSQDVFKFGLTEASVIEFEVVGVANMYGMTIQCFNEIDCSSLSAAEIADIESGTWDGTWDGTNKVFAVPYGVYRVESCPRDHQAMAHRKVTAYTEKPTDTNPFEAAKDAMLLPGSNQYSPSIDSLVMGQVARTTPQMLLANGYAAQSLSLMNTPLIDATGTGQIYHAFAFNKTLQLKNPLGITINVVFRCTVASDAQMVEHQFSQTNIDNRNLFKVDHQWGAVQDAEAYQNGAQALAQWGIDAAESGYNSLEDIVREQFPPFYPFVGYGIVPDFVDSTFVASFDGVAIIPNGEVIYPYREVRKAPSNKVKCAACLYWLKQAEMQKENSPYDQTVLFYAAQRTNPEVTMYVPETAQNQVQVSFESTLKTRKTISTGFATKKKDVFSFADAFSAVDIANGWLEMTGRFATAARSGGMTLLRLSNSSPVAIAPGGYSQMWWDEYNVEPIGTIRYSFTDEAGEEQIVDYKFGDGASIYDMTDNAVLKAMSGTSPEVIESLLDTYFVPHLAPINFVPIDLNMKGLPYIESGDALAVTAQDGTVCNSYALRQEIDGIQSLTAQIDSESGLILDSEEGD